VSIGKQLQEATDDLSPPSIVNVVSNPTPRRAPGPIPTATPLSGERPERDHHASSGRAGSGGSGGHDPPPSRGGGSGRDTSPPSRSPSPPPHRGGGGGGGGGGSDPGGSGGGGGSGRSSSGRRRSGSSKGSEGLMRLPAVSNLQFYWDGNSSTLRSYLKQWEVAFDHHTDNQIIPFLKTLFPQEHLWRLKFCQKGLTRSHK